MPQIYSNCPKQGCSDGPERLQKEIENRNFLPLCPDCSDIGNVQTYS